MELIGHRGARGDLPENTMVSFAHALALGVHGIELDVGMSADGVAVVVHDRRLNVDLTRTPEGRWLRGEAPVLKDLSFEQLSQFDVGRVEPSSHYAARFPQQTPCDGARIPTLDSVVALVSGARARLIIEIKTSPEHRTETVSPELLAQAVIEIVARHETTQSTIIESFDWRVMAHVQRVAGDISTAYLTVQQAWMNNVAASVDGPSAWTAGWSVEDFDGCVPSMVQAAGGQAWAPFHRDATAGNVRRAHELGLSVFVWTVNEQSDMRALADLGVDGIITDYPGRLRDVMHERGMSLPVPVARP